MDRRELRRTFGTIRTGVEIFFVNKEEHPECLTMKDRKTCPGRIMEELDVNMHPASAPQAKGRIEQLPRLYKAICHHNSDTVSQTLLKPQINPSYSI
jgi:hypothetical protein